MIDTNILITGDKDFLESEVKNPKIINVSDFLDYATRTGLKVRHFFKKIR